jgi:hypothetical protein
VEGVISQYQDLDFPCHRHEFTLIEDVLEFHLLVPRREINHLRFIRTYSETLPLCPFGDQLQATVAAAMTFGSESDAPAVKSSLKDATMSPISGKSDVKKLNNAGKITEPRGTPIWTVLHFDWYP